METCTHNYNNACAPEAVFLSAPLFSDWLPSCGVMHCGVLLDFMLFSAALRDPDISFFFTHQENIDNTGV